MTEKTDKTPLVNDDFRDKSGRWGGESKRDAVPLSHDRFGDPVDRVYRQSDPRMENPYNR